MPFDRIVHCLYCTLYCLAARTPYAFVCRLRFARVSTRRSAAQNQDRQAACALCAAAVLCSVRLLSARGFYRLRMYLSAGALCARPVSKRLGSLSVASFVFSRGARALSLLYCNYIETAMPLIADPACLRDYTRKYDYISHFILLFISNMIYFFSFPALPALPAHLHCPRFVSSMPLARGRCRCCTDTSLPTS